MKFVIEFVLPEGFEPSPTGPEPAVLSITPWEQFLNNKPSNFTKYLQVKIKFKGQNINLCYILMLNATFLQLTTSIYLQNPLFK